MKQLKISKNWEKKYNKYLADKNKNYCIEKFGFINPPEYETIFNTLLLDLLCAYAL